MKSQRNEVPYIQKRKKSRVGKTKIDYQNLKQTKQNFKNDSKRMS